MERGKVNLSTRKKGDLLISALGARLIYLRPTTESEQLDHVVQYQNKGLGFGTRTNDGYVFKLNKIPYNH